MEKSSESSIANHQSKEKPTEKNNPQEDPLVKEWREVLLCYGITK